MKKTVFLGFLVIVLAFCFIGCDENIDSENNGKTITVNGIGISGNVTVIVFVHGTSDQAVAWGTLSNVTSGSNVTFSLKEISGVNFLDTNWKGSGTYTVSVFNLTAQQILDSPQAPDMTFQTVNLTGTTAAVSWNNN